MKFLIALLLITSFKSYSLEYSKIDFDGCPENSYCKKETGINRKKWIEQLKDFSSGKISEQKLNTFIQAEYGFPISGWAQETASLLPNILMWDSPCKQHQNSNNKYYISELFRKNFNPSELKEYPPIFFSRAIVLDNNKITSYTIPRGDAPLYMKDGNLYFLREEEGIFYGLLIGKDGAIRLTKNQTSSNPPKETECTKDQIAMFLREAPSPNFYQGHYCKEIWDQTSKSYKSTLLGWSCN